MTSNQLLSKHPDVVSLLKQGYSQSAIMRMTGKSSSTVCKVTAAVWEDPFTPSVSRSPIALIADILSGKYWGGVLENLVVELVGDIDP